jgi:TrmH family RNA methyltransferase
MLKSVARLTQKKFRHEERKFIVEGLRAVEEALESDWRVEMLLVGDPILSKGDAAPAMRSARAKKCPIYEVSAAEIERLSDTITSQGILAVVSIKGDGADKDLSALPNRAVVVALDGIADPGNAGTMLRTCDWFGVDAVLMGRNSVDLYSPKVVRGAMGSIFHLQILPEVDLLKSVRLARKGGFKVFVTVAPGNSSSTTPLFPMKTLPGKILLIFGNEAHGVSKELMNEADGHISIPKFGRAESLNVAISCGVILGAIRLNNP